MERAEISSPPPAAIAAKTPVGYSGIAYHLLIKKPSFSVIIGVRIKPSLPFSKWIKMHETGLKLFIHRYNTELFPIVG